MSAYLLVFIVGAVVGLAAGRAIWTHRALRHLGTDEYRKRRGVIRDERRRSRLNF